VASGGPYEGVRTGDGADRAHRADREAELQEAATAAPDGDEGAQATSGEPDQSAGRHGQRRRSGTVAEAAGKGKAAVKGQVDALRAAVTEQAETHLRNVQEELREEHAEITLYNRIEGFANAVGDKETAKLLASIRREEERMAKYLHAEMMRLVKEVVRAEVPRAQRQTASRRPASRRRTGARSGSKAGTAAG
jgi:hypothetical protein